MHEIGTSSTLQDGGRYPFLGFCKTVDGIIQTLGLIPFRSNLLQVFQITVTQRPSDKQGRQRYQRCRTDFRGHILKHISTEPNQSLFKVGLYTRRTLGNLEVQLILLPFVRCQPLEVVIPVLDG
ncbi:hypothetical protein [Neisseria meningitidis]|uniref:hypothetical protein n=1 Tax=Neisseria meningitidis TaxID=487 RepID=UPI0005E20EB6|nr:hypothetical protein [Neisseria meningitidis]CKK10224.1 Uncharacterised protein [Neisseria meningitidis]CKK74701.1 Uncharacterised protein [Neisseria meningitidis]